jgi:hypothetical protein
VDELERGEPSPLRPGEPSPQSEGEQSPQRDAGKRFRAGGREPSSDDAMATSPDSNGERSREGNDASDPGAQVMGRLPRTRPQRRSERRPASTTKASPGATPKRKPAARRAQRTTSGSAARSPASSAARTRSTRGQTAGRRPPETATRAAARKHAPGIPQLAAGAVVGAAKAPLKVTASVTRQATQMIGRALRLR